MSRFIRSRFVISVALLLCAVLAVGLPLSMHAAPVPRQSPTRILPSDNNPTANLLAQVAQLQVQVQQLQLRTGSLQAGPSFSQLQSTLGTANASVSLNGQGLTSVASVAGSGTTTLGLYTGVADGSSAMGLVVNNTTTLSNAAARLASWQNNGVEKAAILYNGGLITPSIGVDATHRIMVPGGNGLTLATVDQLAGASPILFGASLNLSSTWYLGTPGTGGSSAATTCGGQPIGASARTVSTIEMNLDGPDSSATYTVQLYSFPANNYNSAFGAVTGATVTMATSTRGNLATFAPQTISAGSGVWVRITYTGTPSGTHLFSIAVY